MDLNELVAEFKKLGATVGDHDGQPGTLIQGGRVVLRVNSKMLFMDEAHDYLRQLRDEAGQPQT